MPSPSVTVSCAAGAFGSPSAKIIKASESLFSAAVCVWLFSVFTDVQPNKASDTASMQKFLMADIVFVKWNAQQLPFFI